MKTPKPGCQYVESLPADAVAIPDFPKCFATPDGSIYTQHGRTKRRRFGRNGAGYPICGLRRNDGVHCFPLVHRVIARLFVPGDTSLTVNHIDMNKENCAASNLEWVTFSDNHKKGHGMNPEWGAKISKAANRAVVATNPQTGEQHTFPSGKAAALWVGTPTSSGNISKATISGRMAYGYTWRKT